MNNMSTDEYRAAETYAPSGTVDFRPDPNTGEERIDLHASTLRSLTEAALALANPTEIHPDGENIDASRIETYDSVVSQEKLPLDTLQQVAHITGLCLAMRAARLDAVRQER